MSPRYLWPLGLAILLAGCSPSGPDPAAAATTPTTADDPKTDDGDGNADALVSKAMQAQDAAGALTLVEEALKADPKHRRGLFLLMAITQQQAMEQSQADRAGSIPKYLESAKAARKLRDLYKNLDDQEAQVVAIALYSGACSLAIDGKADEAMTALTEAIDAGFADKNLLKTNAELDSLRDTPEFKALADTMAKKAEEGMKRMLAENKPFPFSFQLPDLEGKAVSLDDYKGKVVIVDIWGTWCPPCRQEIPHFVELSKTYKDQGLEIVGINYERVPDEEVKQTIADFKKEFEVPYVCVIGDEKTQEQVPDFQGYPTTLFLDRTGVVRLKLVGYTELDELEAIVKTLLEEPAAEAAK